MSLAIRNCVKQRTGYKGIYSRRFSTFLVSGVNRGYRLKWSGNLGPVLFALLYAIDRCNNVLEFRAD